MKNTSRISPICKSDITEKETFETWLDFYNPLFFKKINSISKQTKIFSIDLKIRTIKLFLHFHSYKSIFSPVFDFRSAELKWPTNWRKKGKTRASLFTWLEERDGITSGQNYLKARCPISPARNRERKREQSEEERDHGSIVCRAISIVRDSMRMGTPCRIHADASAYSIYVEFLPHLLWHTLLYPPMLLPLLLRNN